MHKLSTPATSAKAYVEFTLPDGRIVRQPLPRALATRRATGPRGKTTPTASQLRDLYEQYGFAHQSVVIAAHQEAFPMAAAKQRELTADEVNEHLDALALASENRRTIVQPDSVFPDDDFVAYDAQGEPLERDCPATVAFLTSIALGLALAKMADAEAIHRVPTGRMNKHGEEITMKGYYSFYPAVRRTAAELRAEAANGDGGVADDAGDDDVDTDIVDNAVSEHGNEVEVEALPVAPAPKAKKVSRK